MRYKTYRTKERGFQIIIFKAEDSEKDSYVFLNDPWKFGIREFDTFNGNLETVKRKIGLPDVKFHRINADEAKKLLAHGKAIADRLGVELNTDTIKFLKKLEISDPNIDGTIYKCFNCEKGNLKEEEVNEILEVAKNELKQGNIGTEDEEQYFYVCDNCKQEMHESHT